MYVPDALKWIIGMSYNTGSAGLPASGTTLQLRVPFEQQQHVNLCGDAAALMIAKFWQIETLINLQQNSRGVLEGSSVTEHAGLTTYGGTLKWSPAFAPAAHHAYTSAEIRTLLSERGPMACTLAHSLVLPVIGTTVAEWGHWIVLVGVDTASNTLSYHDPWRGQHKLMPLATFNQQLDWDDSEAMVYLSGWGP